MDELRKKLVTDLKNMIIRATGLDDVAPGDIDDAEPLFVEGLGLDSIDALELVVALETDFGIRITDAAVAREAFSSVSALADFVEKNRP